jgi:hypothetical protein
MEEREREAGKVRSKLGTVKGVYYLERERVRFGLVRLC